MASPVAICHQSQELCKKIEVNDASTMEEDLAVIKEWLRKQPHLPDEWETNTILNTLRSCNYSLERTKHKIDMYFSLRTACPEFFTNRDIRRPELLDLLTRGQGGSMLSPEGYRIIFVRGLTKKFESRQVVDAFKLTTMICDILMKEGTNTVAGDMLILDGDMLTQSHVANVPWIAVKKFVVVLQTAYPIKLKAVHVLNAAPFIKYIYNVIKPFIKEKIRKRIFFHDGFGTLHDHIPKDYLPREFGGTRGSLVEETKYWLKKLEEYTDWFKAQESIVVDEALRPGKPKDYDELFGMDGSFRKLSID